MERGKVQGGEGVIAFAWLVYPLDDLLSIADARVLGRKTLTTRTLPLGIAISEITLQELN